jgi:Fe-only nitrogenase accessory protein AnfO
LSNGSCCRDIPGDRGRVSEIAAVLGPDGLTLPLDEPGRVAVYGREDGAWKPLREMSFTIDRERDLRELRHTMQSFVEFLGECRVLVARSARGVPLFELEKARRTVWEIGGDPEDFLEEVWREESAAGEADEAASAIPVPEEISPGNYYLSIRELQEESLGVSSKQVLQAFVRRGAFRSLTILCNHVPPWLNLEAMNTGCRLDTERMGDHEYRVRLDRRESGGCG